jgi:beta-lactamase regulating signal transducer with metallopeptidase domain
MISPLLLDYPILSLFLKFMIASTALLGSVWLLEKLKIINTPDASDMAWKLAILASFIALLPVSLTSKSIVIPINAIGTTTQIAPVPPIEQITEEPLPSSKSVNAEIADIKSPPKASPVSNAPINTGLTPLNTFEDTSLNSPGQILIISWLILALVALVALTASYRRAISNLGSRTRVPAEHSANQALRSICERANIRHVPYLSRSSEINSPVCLPRREVCLPEWAFDDMDAEALKSLIAHELAHMLRRDPAKIIMMQTLCRIFFFQPLFTLARCRIEDNAELAADEWAAKQMANASAVADALYTCAKKITEKRQTQWGLAMAGDKSILKQRIERLINAKDRGFLDAGTGKRTLIASGIAVLVLAVPSVEFASALNPGNPEPTLQEAPSTPPEPARQDGASRTRSSSSLSTEDDGFETGNLTWSKNDRSIRASWEGKFKVADDEKSIESVSEGGSLTITSGEKNKRRRIRYENNDGSLEVTFWKGNKKHELDSLAEQWVAESLETLLQFTTMDIENRVKRYLAKGGTDGALDKMVKLHSDFIKREFLNNMVRYARFNDDQLRQLFRIISAFESDFEIRLSMITLMNTGLINEANLETALNVANGIDSDYEMRLALVPLIDNFHLSDDALNKLLNLASKIESDNELRLLLASAMSRNEFSEDNQRKLIKVSESLESDYELRLALTQFATIAHTDGTITEQLLNASKSIESDYEKRLALAAIISQSEMNTPAWTTAIQLAKTINGDYEKRLILSQIAEQLPSNEKLESAWLKAAKSISSDHERGLLLNNSE